MTSLLSRFVRPRRRAGHLVFTVYCREGCGCCEKAFEAIEPHRKRHGFRVEKVDVDSDPSLAEAHGASVPVVAIDGKVQFRGLVNPVLLVRLLEAEAKP